jgi:hypothetical protein
MTPRFSATSAFGLIEPEGGGLWPKRDARGQLEQLAAVGARVCSHAGE